MDRPTESVECYSERVDAALALAAASFRHVRRKGTRVPYLAHLLQVATWVAEYGGDEEQIIAALLHDYLEDIVGSSADELEERFSPRVRRMVVALSDGAAGHKGPWAARKQRYIARLRDEPAEVKLIAASDKLHNATSILLDLERIGDALWQRFSASRDQSLWYYRAVVEALESNWQHPLLERLRTTVAAVHRAAGVAMDSDL